jgi:hypothetical protein
MISDWLELDAADDWVRHDSEIVSLTFISCRPSSIRDVFEFSSGG